MTYAPVEIVHERDHQFVPKPRKPGMKKPPPGCATCNGAKTHIAHHGATQSVNEFLSKPIQVYRTTKANWQARLIDLIRESGLQPCGRIVAEGAMCFPEVRKPDQGNHRFLIEKALGDALVAGGWLPDDTWDRFEFGGLAYVHEPGRSWTRLMLFPSGGVHELARPAA